MRAHSSSVHARCGCYVTSKPLPPRDEIGRDLLLVTQAGGEDYQLTPGREQLPPFCSQRAPELVISKTLMGAPTSRGWAALSMRMSRSSDAAEPTLRGCPELAT